VRQQHTRPRQLDTTYVGIPTSQLTLSRLSAPLLPVPPLKPLVPGGPVPVPVPRPVPLPAPASAQVCLIPHPTCASHTPVATMSCIRVVRCVGAASTYAKSGVRATVARLCIECQPACAASTQLQRIGAPVQEACLAADTAGGDGLRPALQHASSVGRGEAFQITAARSIQISPAGRPLRSDQPLGAVDIVVRHVEDARADEGTPE